MAVDGVALPDVILPSTGSMDTFDTAYLGAKMLGHGKHDLKIRFVDGGVDVDWIFAKKADSMMSFKSDVTGCLITAQAGGNSTFTSNVLPANGGSFERFSVNDLVAGSNGTLSDGHVVNFQSYNGYYMTAESSGGSNGGGGSLTANRRAPGIYEKFTLVKVSGSAGSTIAAGDKIALRSHDDLHYLTVINGTTVNVTGTSIGAGQTFTINLTQQQ